MIPLFISATISFIEHIEVDGGVVGRTCEARLVADPSHFGIGSRAHRAEDDGVGLVLTHEVSPSTPVVFCFQASCAVPPFFVYFAVLGEYFLKLICVVGAVLG